MKYKRKKKGKIAGVISDLFEPKLYTVIILSRLWMYAVLQC